MRHDSLRASMTCLLGACLVALGSTASAGTIEITTIRGQDSAPLGIVDQLGKSLTYHSVAMERWFTEATSTVPVIRKDFTALRSHFQKATFAELEYTYVNDGVTRTVVYHAVSGHDAPYYLKSPASAPTTPVSPMPPVGAETAPGWSPTKSFDEYFPVSDVQQRARILRDDKTELFADDELVDDGFSHARDAELKGLRSIERDIRQGRVAAGGELSIAVSKPVCGSCDAAIRKFATLYDANVHVTEFGEGSQAWALFKRTRTEVLQRIWGHTVQRQVSNSSPGSSSGSFAEDLGEDVLELCGPR